VSGNVILGAVVPPVQTYLRSRQPYQSRHRRFPWLAFFITVVSCTPATLPQPAVPAPEVNGPDAIVASVRDLGPVRFLPVIRGRDGGYSTLFDGRSVWVFGDSPLNSQSVDGSRWRSSTWGWTAQLDARHGIALQEPLDRNGAPGEFLPFTPEELAYNKAHDRDALPDDQRSRWRLWPAPLVVDPKTGKAFVFYGKFMSRNGPWAFEAVGESIATWDTVERPPVRPEVAPGANEPTLLFPAGDAPAATSALAAGDWLYTFRCPRDGLTFPCILARVAFADALTRSAWRFFAGNGRWTDDWHAAIRVMNASPQASVYWNDHLGRYLAVYNTPLANTIEIRTAEHLEGPWSNSRVVLTGRAAVSKGAGDYCGMAHAELAQDHGRLEFFTYCRDTGWFTSEIRLVEIAFK
jgi:hypothetical protein